MIPFRDYHTLAVLKEFEEKSLPLDLCLSDYFRSHKSLGPKDRGVIAEAIYGMTRWKGYLDHLIGKPLTWERRLSAYQTMQKPGTALPAHIQVSFPKWLFERIVASWGEAQAMELCLASNQMAPTTVRVNALKGTRESLFDRWKEKYDVSVCKHSPYGIVFHKKINFFELPEFKEGLFEIQDEGSQLIAEQVQATQGQWVMDYCSGSGGKTLAFAPKMEHTGQIFLHDIRPKILQEAKRRLRRAGIQNAQIVLPGAKKLGTLRNRCDWVLADVPCSGTGTLRRNPDLKWKLTEEAIQRLVQEQRDIFAKALEFVKPKGHLVYATCSLLNEENQEQLAYFLANHPVELVGAPFQSVPKDGGMDGFYSAVLKRK